MRRPSRARLRQHRRRRREQEQQQRGNDGGTAAWALPPLLRRGESPGIDPDVHLELVEVGFFDRLAGGRPAEAEREAKRRCRCRGSRRSRCGARRASRRRASSSADPGCPSRTGPAPPSSPSAPAGAGPSRRSTRAPGSRACGWPSATMTTLVAGVVQLTMMGRCVSLLTKSLSANAPAPFTSMMSALPCGASAWPAREKVSG